jgi:hypothetical protein
VRCLAEAYAARAAAADGRPPRPLPSDDFWHHPTLDRTPLFAPPPLPPQPPPPRTAPLLARSSAASEASAGERGGAQEALSGKLAQSPQGSAPAPPFLASLMPLQLPPAPSWLAAAGELCHAPAARTTGWHRNQPALQLHKDVMYCDPR